MPGRGKAGACGAGAGRKMGESVVRFAEVQCSMFISGPYYYLLPVHPPFLKAAPDGAAGARHAQAVAERGCALEKSMNQIRRTLSFGKSKKAAAPASAAPEAALPSSGATRRQLLSQLRPAVAFPKNQKVTLLSGQQLSKGGAAACSSGRGDTSGTDQGAVHASGRGWHRPPTISSDALAEADFCQGVRGRRQRARA